MFKFGSTCLVTGTLCAAGGALAADLVKNQVIEFRHHRQDRLGTDRSVGVDDLPRRLLAGRAPSL